MWETDRERALQWAGVTGGYEAAWHGSAEVVRWVERALPTFT